MQRRQTPEEIELEKKQAEYRELVVELAEKELELATLRVELHRFELRYIRKVGCLYAVLDELEAKIAEIVAFLHPNNVRAKKIAEDARYKAQKSTSESSSQDDQLHAPQDQFKPSRTLKELYRSAAKALHPDLAEDDTDRARRHMAMAAINEAYEKGDENRIRAILEEWEPALNRSKVMERLLSSSE